MKLPEVEQRTAKQGKRELQNIKYRITNFEGWNRSRSASAPAAPALARRVRGVCAACREIMFKQTEYIHSTFISFFFD